MAENAKRHWKIYRGTLRHRDMGTEVYWDTSEAGIKRLMREVRNNDREAYEDRGQYSAIYIEPTKSGVVEWLRRNVNYDNG